MTIKAIINDLSSDLYDIYFNDYIENFDIIINNNISRYSNNRLQNYNNELIENIFESFENFENIKQEFNNMNDFIKYYHLEKKNGKNWNNKEKAIYKKVYENFNNCNYTRHLYYNDEITQLITIIKCKKYNYVTLRGFSQGEETTLYYNDEEIKNHDIKLIESLYFGGCKEIIFTDENIRKPENIYNTDYYNYIVPYDYNIDDIKQYIKDYYKTYISNYNEKNFKISIYEAIEKQVIKTEYKKI